MKGQAKLPTHHINHQIFNMIKDGSQGRPDIYMWYCYAPVYSNGDCKANAAVLKDEALIPFSVCINPFYDEPAALADIILPDATYLERWDWEDMVSPNQVPEHYIRQPLVKPLGEVQDFGDVVCDLADRMGFPLGIKSKEEFVKKSCEMTPGVKQAGGFEYMKAHGVWHDPKAKPKYYSYAETVKAKDLTKDGVILDEATGVYWNWKKAKVKTLADAKAKGYAHTKKSFKAYVGQKIGDTVYKAFPPDAVNKTGYLELYSAIMEENGLPAMPTFKAIPEHEAMKPDDMILTTFKVNVQTHSRTQNCKWLTEIYHDNPAWINPASAKARGIKEGDRIMVKSSVGEIETTARVTPAVAPDVIAISMHCGHWEYGRTASGKKAPFGTDDPVHDEQMWWKSQGEHPNWIIPNAPDPISGQQRWMDTVVNVRKLVST